MNKILKFAAPAQPGAGNWTPGALTNGATVFDNNYLDEMKTELLGKIVLEGDTMDWAHLIPGVKNRISLNELVGVGAITEATCGWKEDPGTIDLVQRELIVNPLEIKDSICPKHLEQTYLGMYMKTNKEVPFVGVIADQYVKTAHKGAENTIWQGTAANAGLYSIADNDTAVIDASGAVNTATTMIDKVKAMIAAAPAEVLEREDGVLCMSYTDFMTLVQELNSASNYHIEFNEGAPMEFYFPGTRIMVKAVAGLNNITAPTKGNNMILTYADNIAVGTDMLNDEEVFDMWYSRDHDEVRVNVQFKIGANFFFPEFVVKGYQI